jgi:hypothetical protein
MSASDSRAVQEFRVFREEPGTAVATAAIKALTGRRKTRRFCCSSLPPGVIKRCSANTMMGLQKELDVAAQELRADDPTISLISGTELFLRFVSAVAPSLLAHC